VQLGRESRNKAEEVCQLSKALGDVTIVKKGPHDIIACSDKCEFRALCILALYCMYEYLMCDHKRTNSL